MLSYLCMATPCLVPSTPVPCGRSEMKVSYYYNMMRSLSRGDAIIKYLEIILSLPMYSVHYFEVKVRDQATTRSGCGSFSSVGMFRVLG